MSKKFQKEGMQKTGGAVHRNESVNFPENLLAQCHPMPPISYILFVEQAGRMRYGTDD